jgi:hypothetical protein
MLRLKYQIQQNENTIEQILTANDKYVLITVGKNKMLFSVEECKSYMINESFGTLQIIHTEKTEREITIAKAQLGEIILKKASVNNLIHEIFGYSKREFEITNNSSKIAISGKLTMVLIPELNNTGIGKYLDFDKNNQPFVFPRAECEVTSNMHLAISSPLGIQNQELELKSVERIDYDKNFEEIFSYIKLS